jgi:hypothetical protein
MLLGWTGVALAILTIMLASFADELALEFKTKEEVVFHSRIHRL